MRTNSSAPGKINLTGEYASIYGRLVTLAGVQLRTRVEAVNGADQICRFESDKSDVPVEMTISELKHLWSESRKAWNKFNQTNQLEILMPFRRRKLIAMILSVGSVIESRGDLQQGVNLKAVSELPIGSGLGSSSSITAASIGSIMTLLGLEVSYGELNKMVYSVEEIMHGRPSGGDNTGVVYGGVLRFQRREHIQNTIEQLEIKNQLPDCLLIHSGTPEESTAEMVDMVRKSYEKSRTEFDGYMDEIGRIGKRLQDGLVEGGFKYECISENERVLEKIGIVGNIARKIINTIENEGGYAKVCGAGGLKSGSGIVIGLHEDVQRLKQLAEEHGWNYFVAKLGGPGWQAEL